MYCIADNIATSIVISLASRAAHDYAIAHYFAILLIDY